MTENQYNDGTLNLESKDLTDKSEIKYNELRDKIKFKGNSRAEYPIFELRSEIE